MRTLSCYLLVDGKGSCRRIEGEQIEEDGVEGSCEQIMYLGGREGLKQRQGCYWLDVILWMSDWPRPLEVCTYARYRYLHCASFT